MKEVAEFHLAQIHTEWASHADKLLKQSNKCCQQPFVINNNPNTSKKWFWNFSFWLESGSGGNVGFTSLALSMQKNLIQG